MVVINYVNDKLVGSITVGWKIKLYLGQSKDYDLPFNSSLYDNGPLYSLRTVTFHQLDTQPFFLNDYCHIQTFSYQNNLSFLRRLLHVVSESRSLLGLTKPSKKESP